MDYLTSDKNTLVWFIFTIYAVTALLIVPNNIKLNLPARSSDNAREGELQVASLLVLRTSLILPMLMLIKNIV